MQLCGRKCFIESPLVILLYILTLASITYLLVYAVLAANFGAWSYIENLTYYFSLCGNGIYFSCGIYLIYFYLKHDKYYYQQRRFAASNVVLTLAFLFGIGNIYCFLHEPTKAEVRLFLRNRFRSYGKVRSIFGEMENERKCCGIHNYKDYMFAEDRAENAIMHDGFVFPESCCKVKKHCHDRMNETNFKRLWQHGCINRTLAELHKSRIYNKFYLIKLCVVFPMLFPFITIIVIQIILCHTRRRRKKEGRRRSIPGRVHSWENPNNRREVQVVFQSPRVPTEGSPKSPGQAGGGGPSGGDGDDGVNVLAQNSSLDSIAAYESQVSHGDESSNVGNVDAVSTKSK